MSFFFSLSRRQKLQRFFVAIFLIFVLCGIVGCKNKESRLTNKNLEKIQPPMTQVSVEEILGKPDKIEKAENTGITSSTYHYQLGEKRVKIVFLNDKVFAKSGDF